MIPQIGRNLQDQCGTKISTRGTLSSNAFGIEIWGIKTRKVPKSRDSADSKLQKSCVYPTVARPAISCSRVSKVSKFQKSKVLRSFATRFKVSKLLELTQAFDSQETWRLRSSTISRFRDSEIYEGFTNAILKAIRNSDVQADATQK